MFTVFVLFKVALAEKDRFIDALAEAARNTRNESGNHFYDFSENEDNPEEIFLFEGYSTRDDFEIHRNAEYMAVFREAVSGCFLEPPKIIRGNQLAR